ncbi:MAG: hypothetical protein IPH93_12650 [Saprospiraceae bacterium]|nr:hypothetical protein [Saprospiraceae bacterium]MBK9630984.1 hypothetical protein [Saprospiraceae bacterium]
MRKLTRFSLYSILIIYKRIALLFILLIHIQHSSIAQNSPDKLLQCTWADSAQSVLNRKETIVVKIKSGREYKEWRTYSTLGVVLESVENGSLIVSYKKRKNISIPISSIDSIQVINAHPKKKVGLLIIGIIAMIVGSILSVVSVFRILLRLDSPSTGKPVYGIWLWPLLSLLGLGLGIAGVAKYTEFDKMGREINLIDPKCKCEWFERP